MLILHKKAVYSAAEHKEERGWLVLPKKRRNGSRKLSERK